MVFSQVRSIRIRHYETVLGSGTISKLNGFATLQIRLRIRCRRKKPSDLDPQDFAESPIQLIRNSEIDRKRFIRSSSEIFCIGIRIQQKLSSSRRWKTVDEPRWFSHNFDHFWPPILNQSPRGPLEAWIVTWPDDLKVFP